MAKNLKHEEASSGNVDSWHNWGEGGGVLINRENLKTSSSRKLFCQKSWKMAGNILR